MGEEAPPEMVDAFFGALADERRRHVLHYLRNVADDDVEVAELVAFLDATGSTRVPRSQIATELRHRHLPKLADAGFVDYDPMSQSVDYEGPTVFEPLLDRIEDL